MEAQPTLSTIMTDCGIFKEFTEDFSDVNDASIASPSSIHSEMEQNQELINELEEFFIKVDGKPTVVDETSEPVSLPATNSQTATNDSDSSYDTDPDWSPSPASDPSFDTKILSPPQQTKHRKKYARSRPPQPPSGPYPVEKKERKKAQNRTAAFRYREKKKSEQDMIDEELELLSTKNNVLKDKLTEMETEFKYLKKLMTEAGLGRYAQTVKICETIAKGRHQFKNRDKFHFTLFIYMPPLNTVLCVQKYSWSKCWFGLAVYSDSFCKTKVAHDDFGIDSVQNQCLILYFC